MSKTHRIATKAGRWAQSPYERARVHWVPEAIVGVWREASAGASTPALGKAAARAAELCELMGWHPDPREVLLPLTPEQWSEHAAKLGERRAAHEGAPRRYGSHSAWAEVERMQSSAVEREVATRRQERFVSMPFAAWTAREGDAALYEPGHAHELIEKAALAIELARLLPKAMEVAKASGAAIEPWMEPRAESIGVGTRELARAQCQEFDAASAYEQKRAFAVYVDDQRGRRGFLDAAARVKNDLAEACLLPTLLAATRFAKKAREPGHAVEVDVSAVDCHALDGAPPSDDLSRVIAARERRALERALDGARVDELEAALSRARAALAASGAPPERESGGEAAPRRSRL